ncbi:MAG: dephospho-CoA kinase [Pelagibacteraceae bacterium]
MIAIGVTGSLSSGKSTVSKIIGGKKYPIFSADKVVYKLYKNALFVKNLKKQFKIKSSRDIKKSLKKLISLDKKILKKLEKYIHPHVRKKMFKFIKKNRKKKIIVLEIPLLIESKLMRFFDLIILVSSNKKTRLKRYIRNGGTKKTFNLLDKNQINVKKKIKYSNHTIHNNKPLGVLKDNVKLLISKYE